MIDRKNIISFFKELQNKICRELEKSDGQAKFSEDIWKREGGGSGISRIIQNGNVIEKGGVNFSEVFGAAPDFLSIEEGENSKHKTFFATGISIVIHSESPMVPIIHMNLRYLETINRCWFGGGIDLTPVYVNEKDVVFFHQTLKDVCDKFHRKFYPEFKKWADEYFFIKHRNETRGTGGIFFDHIGKDEKKMKISFEHFFEFIKAIGNSFIPVYTHLVRKNKNKPYGEKEKQWQLLRRGRYAEFNLVYDKGTKFGFETGGRTESILMSLPPYAKWMYNFIPEKNSAEEKTVSLLKQGIDWAK